MPVPGLSIASIFACPKTRSAGRDVCAPCRTLRRNLRTSLDRGDERNQLLPTWEKFPNRIHLAKSYMVRAGLIDQPRRGRFIASQEGRALLARHPHEINVELLLEYPSFREWKNGGDEELIGDHPHRSRLQSDRLFRKPQEQIESAHATLHSALREDLLQRILQNSPGFFEQVIVDLLVAMGYGGSRRNAATHWTFR